MSTKSLRHGSGIERHTPTILTFSRARLQEIAYETVEIATNGSYLNKSGEKVDVSAALEKAKKNSVHYHYSHTFRMSPVPEEERRETKFGVIYAPALEIAQKMGGGSIGVLNSASAKTPGGKLFKGTVSHEDCICRASLLYPCISQFRDKKDHYYEINASPTFKSTSSACAIFSPDVPVIRRDSVEGDLLDNFYTVSFVTIPAPNAFTARNSYITQGVQSLNSVNESIENIQKELKMAMSDRIHRVLAIFAEHNCRDLVLSAFGCGVHGNEPKVVAEIYRDLLANEFRGRFDRVVFAIQPSRHANFKGFSEVFCDH